MQNGIAKSGAAIVLALLASIARAEPPQRVVSFNNCADQLVLALADPQQIAGLSPYATDPTLSVMAQEARAYRLLDWQAEAAIPLKPDLVLTGAWDRSVTRRMLTRLGFRAVPVEIVGDLEAARRQIRAVAELLGHAGRGTQLVARLDAAAARLAAVRRPGIATALVIERGGYVAGTQSLATTLLDAAGLRLPAGAPAGVGAFVSLERLAVLRPDLVFLKDPPSEPSDQGALYLTHPVLQALYPPQRRIALPTRYTMCGGPALVAAFDYLADAMSRLAAAP